MNMSLFDLNEGETAIIDKLLLKGDIYKRLKNLGLIEGTKVECLHKAPSGDPTAYLIRGAVIAIRNEDSGKISVFKER